MRLAITGGTGFVGQALIERALAEGFELAALTRTPRPDAARLRWVDGDLSDTSALDRLVRGAEAVIHVAGLVNAPDAATFDAANVTGTQNVIAAAQAVPGCRLVFVSSLAAREPDLSLYGASKARAERRVMASGLDWTVVRPPAVYGPRDREMLELFRIARWGLVPVPAAGRTSVIHVDDLAGLLLAIARGGSPVSGRLFEPDDGAEAGWDHGDLARAIGRAVGRRPFVLRLSRRSLDRAARIDRLVRGKGAKMTPDRAAFFSHPDWVVSREAAPPAALWVPRIATGDGMRQTAEWYRRNGWL